MFQSNILKEYFPLLQERDVILGKIRESRLLRQEFEQWTDTQQEEFLDFCTGKKGVKVVSDSFFKEVFNPEYAPERLNDFLSTVLKQKVRVLHVLPNDSVRLASEGSLLITDLVVEMEDGSIINVEVQRIGYMFPGERAACYSADLLLRQYKRVRDKKGKTFTYKNVKPVYTIVLFEKSPVEFHSFVNDYMHYAETTTNTGLEINLLQKYLFIPLDIFRETSQNKPIRNKTEAWLTFLSTEKPERIIELILAYPEFKTMYDDIYELCRNIEEVMNMFSKELYILDRNTEQYMMDEMQAEINGLKIERQSLQADNESLQADNESLQADNESLQADNESLQAEKQSLQEENQLLQEQKQILQEQEQLLEDQVQILEEQEQLLKEQDRLLKDQVQLLEGNEQLLKDENQMLQEKLSEQELRIQRLEEHILKLSS